MNRVLWNKARVYYQHYQFILEGKKHVYLFVLSSSAVKSELHLTISGAHSDFIPLVLEFVLTCNFEKIEFKQDLYLAFRLQTIDDYSD